MGPISLFADLLANLSHHYIPGEKKAVKMVTVKWFITLSGTFMEVILNLKAIVHG